MPVSERMEAILTSLDKAHTGPLYAMKDWDVKILPKAVKGILKKYNLAKTCDMENPINTDDELADQFFKAGYELALELGFYCEDTERVIKVTEDEIKHALAVSPRQMVFGAGKDEVVMIPRRPESPTIPKVVAPLALMAEEKYVVGILAGTAKYRLLVDVLNGMTIERPTGRETRAGTPYETWLGFYEQELKRHALKLIDREEMGTCGVGNAVTEYGHLGGCAATPGRNPLSMCLLPAEMKITFANFHRAINAINYGHMLHAGGPTFIGGYAGSVEGAILVSVANDLLLSTILRVDNTNSNIYDINTFCNTLPKAIWGNSVAIQATTRNTDIMTNRIVNMISGPMTQEFFYEAAVGHLNYCVSGATKVLAPRSAGGRYVNYITPVEAWWCGQVFKSSAGLTRADANDIIKRMLPKYKDELVQPKKGVPCNECFDFERLEPTPEYKALYKQMEKEMIDFGIPVDRFSVL